MIHEKGTYSNMKGKNFKKVLRMATKIAIGYNMFYLMIKNFKILANSN